MCEAIFKYWKPLNCMTAHVSLPKVSLSLSFKVSDVVLMHCQLSSECFRYELLPKARL